MTDAAGTRSIAYNRYGEAETDELSAGSMTHTITEQRDTLGRSTGYVYAKNDIPQQQTTIGYGADGRIATAGFTHQGEHKEFLYSYLPGTHLLHTLTHPNGLTLTQSYDATRDLPTQMSYSRADALVVQRAYTYDLLGRPTARDLARYGTETQDTFGYNTRSELTAARINSADYSYAYDAIGNRTAATEAGTSTAYTANKLNQYTAEGSFRPTFDADGNQTLIKTSTGTWNVTYNAKNRPVLFAKSDNSVTVECTYDTMGRRATKKVTTNGTLTEHRRFLYRGYLQIACCDLTRAYTPALWFITWDPTQETATRPLAIQKNGTWYTYGWDLTKNICETYRTDARIDLAYTYTPYGECTPAHTYDQPLRWSSEYHDVELGLVYYNYRHYNPVMGRWMRRDPIPEVTVNLYNFISNIPSRHTDKLGMQICLCFSYDLGNMIGIDTGKSGKTIEQEFKTANKVIWSGNAEYSNEPCCQHIPNKGPIPIGKYKIESLIIMQGWTPYGDWEWYPLSPYLNDRAYNSLNVPIPGTDKYVSRSGFYIHAGNRSDGCVSFSSDVPCADKPEEDPNNYPHSDEYDKLKIFIKKSKSSAGARFLYVREHYSECSAIINKIKSSATN